MAKFKLGDRVVCVDDSGCPHLSHGNSYEVTRVGGDYIELCDDSGRRGVCYFPWRFELLAFIDSCVKCVDATGSDLTEGRFYTVRDITDGGALILHGNDSRPYRRDRFELADNSEWVSQTIRERDAARKEFESCPLTIESGDNITFSPPVNPAGWDVEIDHTTNPMSPTVKLKKRSFQLGDTVSPTEVIGMPPWIIPIESQLIIRAVYPDGCIRVGNNFPKRVPSDKFRLVKKSDQCIT